jgi:hypothetical protein
MHSGLLNPFAANEIRLTGDPPRLSADFGSGSGSGPGPGDVLRPASRIPRRDGARLRDLVRVLNTAAAPVA